nr:immunoglobulin heavy chain junction region [Macaca mulatta]
CVRVRAYDSNYATASRFDVW